MKILKLRLTNLNSLKGTFEIDFTDRALAAGGIFAITGPTGSGKTTILDAISLALFGETPRLGRGADTEELMTRGTGGSEAVVEFSTRIDGRALVFRATWERRRARGRPDGRLQNATMKLDQVSPRQPGDAWDADGPQQVRTAVEQVTGLDFKRFTRTCLLAQGQFAAFLEAGNDERGKILEQITGTGIYTELSKAAFQRDKQERERLDLLRQRLQGVTLLSDAEFRILRDRTAALTTERQALEKERLAIALQIAWVERFEALVQSRQALETARQTLADERAAAAADLARLAEARRAEPLRPRFAQQEAARQAAAAKEAELADTRRRLPEARDDQARAEAAHLTAQTDLETFTTEAKGKRDLIGTVRLLDQQRADLAEQLAKALQQKTALAGQVAALEREIAATAAAIATLEAQQAELARRLAASQADSFLGSDLKALREQTTARTALHRRQGELERDLAKKAKELERETKKVARLEAEVAAAEATVAARQTTLEEAAAALAREFPRATAASLKNAVEDAQKQQTYALALWECGKEIRDLHQAEAAHAAALKEREAERQAAQQLVETLEKQREQAEQTVSELTAQQARAALEASLEEHRRALREGEPCPLCGATVHPYAAGRNHDPSNADRLATEVEAARLALKKLDADLKKARKTEQNLLATGGADDATSAAQAKALASLEKKWMKTIAHLDPALLAETRGARAPASDGQRTDLSRARATGNTRLHGETSPPHLLPGSPVPGAPDHDHLDGRIDLFPPSESRQEPLSIGVSLDGAGSALDAALTPEDQDALDVLVATAGHQLAAAQEAFDRHTAAFDTHHQATAALNEARLLAQELATRLAAARGARDTAATHQQALQQNLSEARTQVADLEARLLKTLTTYGITALDDDTLPALEARWSAYQANLTRQAALAQDEQKAKQTLATAQTRQEGLTTQLATVAGTLDELAHRLEELHTERRKLFGDRDPVAEEKRLDADLAALQQRVQTATTAVQEARLKVEALTAAEAQQAKDLSALQAAAAAAAKAVADALTEAGYPDEATARAALLPPPEMHRLADLEQRLEERATHLQGQLAQVAQQIAQQEAARPTARALPDLRAEEAALAERLAAKAAELQASATALTTQENLRRQHAELQREIAAAELARRPWAKLNELIGSSDGKEFQTFAQGLTFGSLVYLANQQLQRLNDRYLLANVGLELRVIDRYISETRASVKNLSGGEKFLASLALALGLAQMVGQNHQMDTLFIDEGFGALDPKALETAMQALCSLQEQDKLVGLISHVEAIRDRLPARIEIQRLGGGFSSLTGPGCRRLA